MVEKRYWTSADESIWDSNSLIWENKKELSIIEVVKLLDEQHETIQQLNDRIEDLYESDRALRKMCSNATHNWTGICVKRELFEETLKTLKELGCEDLADDLSKTSIVTGINGC